MDCPYCKKDIYGMTGLQEIQKFQKHLVKCKKNPKRKVLVDEDGSMYTSTPYTGMEEALEIRANSGQ